MLSAQNLVHAPGNFTMLEDHVQSSKEICTLLVRHLEYVDILPPDQLPLKVPLLFFGEWMQKHPYAITGSFDYMKCVDDANTIVIPYGLDANGAQIIDPVVIQPPVLPPVPSVQVNQLPAPGGGTPVAPAPGNVQDPNVVLIQGVLAVIQAMTQVNLQSDMRNTSMTQHQMQLQAATMWSNAQQLQHLTNHLGNLGTEVGKVIASHPTSHAIQATLSHPNDMPGQSNDP